MSIWRERRRRAIALMERHAHADELLGFYSAVLEAQEPVWRWAVSALSEGSTFSSARRAVEKLDSDDLQSRFEDFVGLVSGVAPSALAKTGGDLLHTSGEAWAAASAAAIGGAAGSGASGHVPLHGLARDGQSVAGEWAEAGLANDALSGLTFFGSAFLEPVVVAARRESGAGSTAGATPSHESQASSVGYVEPTAPCRFCGRAPVVAALRDDQEAKGRRLLICGFCANHWVARRATCPACGEGDTEQLRHHVGESLPHVRLEECRSCGTYHKTIDLRVDGRAVPIVDELATVELDLWARERGLEKLQPNLLRM